MAKWLVSARSHRTRRDFVFRNLEGESVVDTYRRVKAEAEKLKARLGEHFTVDIISCSKAFKIQKNSVQTHRSQIWCPYCIKFRRFVDDNYLGVRRCSICGISDSDFYVRRYNRLWK